MALSHKPSVSTDAPGFPLGAARSSFVASVRKKSAEMAGLLAVIAGHGEAVDSATRVKARATLIGELEVLAQGAESMRVEGMAPVVQEALAIVRRAPKYEVLERDEALRVEALLGSFSTLAYRAGEPTRVVRPTRLALLVGAAEAERVLALPLEDGNSYECVHAASVEETSERATKLLPDVVLVDADMVDMDALLTALEENVSEILPVVAMGSDVDSVKKRWLASGATRVVEKPITPRELRRNVDALFQGERVRKLRGAVGTPTLGALRRLLAEELDRAMTSIEGDDHVAIPLGEGSEVLGALWGAASRIREVVTARTGGAVRFSVEGPNGTIAFAPSLDLDQLSGRRSAGNRQVGSFSLAGLHVLIADDDPAVVWFLADALRQAGATVHEAHDGEAALTLAERVVPDLLVTDILMPKMDGLALSRHLRMHPLLAGTPVLLLSWKEDLLTKVKELGAGAAGYLCKDSDRGMVVFHAREALAPRVRVRARLAEGLEHRQEVHGRFDALTPYGLLHMVLRLGESARITVRDATAHYEVTCQEGRVWAVKTTTSGELVRGEAALTSLLGVRAGRFVVAHTKTTGSEPEALELGAIATAFAARVVQVQAAVEANRDNRDARFRFDSALLAEYTRTVPIAVADALRGLACGERLGDARTSETASWLPETLYDLASRGALIEAGVLAPYAPRAEEIAAAVTAPDAAPAELQGMLDIAPSLAPEQLAAPAEAAAPVQELAAEPNASLELSPSPVTWSVEQALGDTTEIDEVSYAENDVKALQAEVHVQTAPDPTLYGGRDAVASAVVAAAEVVEAREEEPVQIAAPRESLIERAEKRLDSLAPTSTMEDTIKVQKPTGKKSKSRSIFPVALFGAATGGAILLATLLSPDNKGKAAAAATAPALGDTPAGILEVDAKGATVLVDGVPRGRGQRVTVVLPQGKHQVGLEGHAESRQVEVRASEVVRVNLEKAP